MKEAYKHLIVGGCLVLAFLVCWPISNINASEERVLQVTLNNSNQDEGMSTFNQSSTTSTPTSQRSSENITALVEGIAGLQRSEGETGEFIGSALRLGLVEVVYESPTIVVLKANALTSEAAFDISAARNNVNLWIIIDLLRNDLGYNLDKLVVNGLGTGDNQDRFYVVMTK